MNNRFASIMCLGTGAILAVYVAVVNFFMNGINIIVSGTTIVENKIVLDQSFLLQGSLRIILAGLAFIFVLNFFNTMAMVLWNMHHRGEENANS